MHAPISATTAPVQTSKKRLRLLIAPDMSGPPISESDVAV